MKFLYGLVVFSALSPLIANSIEMENSEGEYSNFVKTPKDQTLSVSTEYLAVLGEIATSEEIFQNHPSEKGDSTDDVIIDVSRLQIESLEPISIDPILLASQEEKRSADKEFDSEEVINALQVISLKSEDMYENLSSNLTVETLNNEKIPQKDQVTLLSESILIGRTDTDEKLQGEPEVLAALDEMLKAENSSLEQDTQEEIAGISCEGSLDNEGVALTDLEKSNGQVSGAPELLAAIEQSELVEKAPFVLKEEAHDVLEVNDISSQDPLVQESSKSLEGFAVDEGLTQPIITNQEERVVNLLETSLIEECHILPVFEDNVAKAIIASEEKIQDESLPLYYWRSKNYDFINFGDYISLKIVEGILGQPIEETWQNPFIDHKKLLASGAILQFAQENDVVWGSGIHGKHPYRDDYHFASLDVRAVRGPLSRSFLKDNLGIECPEVYGEPALLFPYLYPEFKRKENPSLDYVVIPHYSEEYLFSKADEHVIYPTQNWHEVIDKILDSKFVISSSLYGIAIAEAFGIPARMLRVTENEPIFKYADYYAGTHRADFKYATSIEEALEMGGEPPAICDLEKLYMAFPFEHWPHIEFKKPHFEK